MLKTKSIYIGTEYLSCKVLLGTIYIDLNYQNQFI